MVENNKIFIDEIIGEINDQINRKEIAIFFGAGLSRESGNLLPNDLVTLILSFN